MKYFALLLLFVPHTLLSQNSAMVAKASMPNTFKVLSSISKTNNRYLLIDIYATWCLPCKKMDSIISQDKELQKELYTNFILFKLQMDSTTKDSDLTKSMYEIGKYLSVEYQISGYPTYLFFTPSGSLVYQFTGTKNKKELLTILKTIKDTSNLVKIDALNSYEREPEKFKKMELDSLSIWAYNMGNKKLAKAIALDYISSNNSKGQVTLNQIKLSLLYNLRRTYIDSIANIYKANYVDRINVLTESILQPLFIVEHFPYLFTPNSPLINFINQNKNKIDSLIGIKGWSKIQFTKIVNSSEIEKVIFDREYITKKQVDWENIKNAIKSKYPGVDVNLLILNAKIRFFKDKNIWKDYTKSLIIKVESYGPFGIINERDFNLNNLAWEIFLYSSDKSELNIALEWSNEAIRICNNSNKANWMDTKANILYKLGRIDEAIKLESQVIEKQPLQDFVNTLNKMKNLEPTWIIAPQ